MPSDQSARNKLNTACQLRRYTVDYEYYTSGPQNQLVHTVLVKINGVEWGRGQSYTKADAKELAASQALAAMQ